MSSHSPRPPHDPSGPVVCESSHDGSGSLSGSVLAALDSLPEFDAKSSEEILYERVDPDALDALFESTPSADRGAGWVSFPIDGYEVSVNAAGEIVIRGQQS